MELTTALTLVFLFILVEAFFSGCEIGLISINRLKIEQRVQDGDRAAIQVQKLLATPERYLATTSLGTNIAVVCSTAVFTAYIVGLIGSWGDFLSMLILSPVILFAGEILPKIVFQSKADSLIPALVHPFLFCMRVLEPVSSLFTAIYQKLFGWVHTSQRPAPKNLLSRQDILNVINPESEHADLEVSKKKMIHRIFHLGKIPVEQCMVPLVQIIGLSDRATLEEANKAANESGYSRLPVFHNRMFNLIGILNTFDLLTAPADETPITGWIRPAYYVPANKKVDDLLEELQQRGLHMAFVVDEYGGCIGIVTVEDLLEEIVGVIEDEYDEPAAPIERYSDGGYVLDGEMEVNAINERLHLNLPEGDYDTLAGLVLDRLERIPSLGDQVVAGDYRLTVRDAGKRKINTIILSRRDPKPPEPENSEGPPSEETGAAPAEEKAPADQGS
ncbi:MAG: hemolysin family protein [Nitrospinaceae bacterium]